MAGGIVTRSLFVLFCRVSNAQAQNVLMKYGVCCLGREENVLTDENKK